MTLEKLLIIFVIAVVLIGPERLPAFAAQLARFTQGLKKFTAGAKERIAEEMGPEFDEVDWRKLDPRQYDPRRIIADALLDSPATSAGGAGAASAASAVVTPTAVTPARPGHAPFDPEAT